MLSTEVTKSELNPDGNPITKATEALHSDGSFIIVAPETPQQNNTVVITTESKILPPNNEGSNETQSAPPVSNATYVSLTQLQDVDLHSEAGRVSVANLKKCIAILERQRCEVYKPPAYLCGFTTAAAISLVPMAYGEPSSDQFQENCRAYNTTSFNDFNTNFSTNCSSIAPLPGSLDFWQPYRAITTLEGIKAQCVTANASTCVSAVDKILTGPGMSTPWVSAISSYLPYGLIPALGWVIYKMIPKKCFDTDEFFIEEIAKKHGLIIHNLTLSNKIVLFKQKLTELCPSETTPLQTKGLRTHSFLRCCNKKEEVDDEELGLSYRRM